MTEKTGKALLADPRLNKSTAFTRQEREQFDLRGLLPYEVSDMASQKQRVLGNLRRKGNDIEKYIFLSALQGRNHRLFFRTLSDHIDELLPLIYTPTVGQACKEFAHIFRQTQGFYITPEDCGQVRRILDNWAEDDVRVIVMTDGERILGLGDLGANGMGIPIGKLALYVACGGVKPEQCLPLMLDVGTDNEELRTDPLYLGWPHERLRGDAYDSLMEELVTALQDKWPRALVQFEDFAGRNAFRLLGRYRDRVCMFNDDIQGTAAATLAGIYAANRISGKAFKELRIMLLGKGGACTGIATLLARAFEACGLSREQAVARIRLVDSTGLVTADRENLDAWIRPFAPDCEAMGPVEAIDNFEPDALIGATGVPGTFTEQAVRSMARFNDRPVIFALSNPTAHAECTAEQAYLWSGGRALFASGSLFEPVEFEGKTLYPGQANNAYIFPGIGLGVSVSGARRVTESMFLAAASALAGSVSEESLESGTLFPPLSEIRAVSQTIAQAVCEIAAREGLLDKTGEQTFTAQAIADAMYSPHY